MTKKNTVTATLIFLCLCSSFLTGCSLNPNVITVKSNKKVVALVKTWEPKVSFYTSRQNPLKTIEGLKQEEIAWWGPELAMQIKSFYDAAGISKRYGNAVQLITPPNLKLAKGSPRLFLTWANNAPRLKDAVMVRFSE